jgi:hypothetical protein
MFDIGLRRYRSTTLSTLRSLKRLALIAFSTTSPIEVKFPEIIGIIGVNFKSLSKQSSTTCVFPCCGIDVALHTNIGSMKTVIVPLGRLILATIPIHGGLTTLHPLYM